MSIHVREKDVLKKSPAGGMLIGPENGATKGYCIGVGIVEKEEYGPPGVHEDQEGFYVIQGTGTTKVGDEEFAIGPGSAYIALKGVPHAVKKTPGSKPLKLLWSHGAV